MDGKPLWMDYLPEVDAVLEAVGWREDEQMMPVIKPRQR